MTRTHGTLEPQYEGARRCWNLIAQNPFEVVATVTDHSVVKKRPDTTLVPEGNTRHLAACWNAIEAIGGDPAKVAEAAGLLVVLKGTRDAMAGVLHQLKDGPILPRDAAGKTMQEEYRTLCAKITEAEAP